MFRRCGALCVHFQSSPCIPIGDAGGAGQRARQKTAVAKRNLDLGIGSPGREPKVAPILSRLSMKNTILTTGPLRPRTSWRDESNRPFGEKLSIITSHPAFEYGERGCRVEGVRRRCWKYQRRRRELSRCSQQRRSWHRHVDYKPPPTFPSRFPIPPTLIAQFCLFFSPAAASWRRMTGAYPFKPSRHPQHA